MNSPREIISCLLAALLWVAGAANGAEKVTLKLKWKHQFQFAGYYAALEKGYYRAAGFDVALVEPAGNEDPIAEVLAGRAQFGIATSELALKRGLGEPVVVLACILQHSPLVLLARGGRENRSIKELAGKRVMMLPHETEIYAYLEREGVGRRRVKLLPHSFNLDDLAAGRVDAQSAYSTDEPWLLERRRVPYRVFTPRSAGVDFYGDSLFTSEAQVRRDAKRVEAFRDASLRGWQYAMAHPGEIAELIVAKYSQRMAREHLLFEAAEMRKLMQPELIEIGYVNPARWRKVGEVYADLGMLPKNFALDGLVFAPTTHAELARVERWVALASAAFTLLAALALWLALRNRALRRRMRDRAQAEAQLERAEQLLQARLAEIRELNARLQRSESGRVSAPGSR